MALPTWHGPSCVLARKDSGWGIVRDNYADELLKEMTILIGKIGFGFVEDLKKRTEA